MDWTFRKPVWAEETITARVTISELTERKSGTGVHFDVVITNQDNEPVATGDVHGVIRG
jgi:acyl dehydratase